MSSARYGKERLVVSCMVKTMPAKDNTALAGTASEGAHLEDDAVAGSDEALDDEQPLPAPQMPQPIHVQQPSSQRRPDDLCHKNAIRREPPASDWTTSMPVSCARDSLSRDICQTPHTVRTTGQLADYLTRSAVSEVD